MYDNDGTNKISLQHWAYWNQVAWINCAVGLFESCRSWLNPLPVKFVRVGEKFHLISAIATGCDHYRSRR